MGESFKEFLKGIAQRGWFQLVSIPSGLVTVLSLYLPNSTLETTILDFLPAIGGSLLVLAVFCSAFLTYHELRLTLPEIYYDQKIAQELHGLVEVGQRLVAQRIASIDHNRWILRVESLLERKFPRDLKMFQTIGIEKSFGYSALSLLSRRGSAVRRIAPDELEAKVGKLRLIMGRYEELQQP